ncbi:MAG TPA: fumarylacetoacetate hydrolase family protein [Phenylobacterium sp.]|uniref:fumarylacetoacetate hydrolase family protein n=1 Tax=Phenylobacterium sp. TaxID=1871053 RepID=UPI002B474C98|nr:fumarylacetoacetate hydrolase family protein [Phenylobacterium sp.]HKR87366.1 fumarylacetoacetate hydrolase family protein [Phenylobacterium sp.]
MRLVTYRKNIEAAARLGVLIDEAVLDVEALGAAHGVALPNTMLGIIDDHLGALPALRDIVGAGAPWPTETAAPLANVRLLAPIPRPRKNIFGIGLNYRAHVIESAGSLDTSPDAPKQPVIFSKPPTTVIGPGESIQHNGKITQQLDWEVELAAIIGTTATRIPVQCALSHVFGYSVMIDMSARDNRRSGQWIYSKGMDTYAPFGPCIVTADEIPDPQNLDLWLTKNGEIKQKSNTSFMIFDVATLISDISQGITLEPGDIIATGTPEGVGAGRTPQEWLWPGDVIEACVESIGTTRHPIVSV